MERESSNQNNQIKNTVGVDIEKDNILMIPTTKDEQAYLEIFKYEIQKAGLIYNSKIVDDNYLVRFLRARKLDIKKTMEMFTTYVKWRKDEDIDNISSFDFKEENDVLSIYPRGLHKTDKFGRPVHYELLGTVDIEQLLKVSSLDRLLRFNVKKIDFLVNKIFPICSKAYGKNVSQFINILDLKGFSIRLMSKKVYDYIRVDSSNMQNGFPEVLGQLFVLNTGYVFTTCWALIKGFLDERTKKKVVFPGKNYLADLAQVVS
jgi:hypothetical protein